jgi:hypothetical protein
MTEEKSKIIIDDDWKAQAQAEKQKLAQEVEASQSAAKPAPAGEKLAEDNASRQPRQIPPASFTTLVSSLVTQILMAMGGYQDPEDGRVRVDLDLAKHHIDSLAMLEEKTRGNLTEDESKLLDQALYEVRMQYVQVAQSVTRI